MRKNPRSLRVLIGLRYCPKCGIVTYGTGLPECRGKVMWRDTGGHVPTRTVWVP